MRRCSRSSTAFTLVELLVVIAIIGMLVALLLPALQMFMIVTRRTNCCANLRQVAGGAMAYHTAHEVFPPGINQFEFRSSPTYRGTSLFAFLLPYLDQGALADRWRYDLLLENADGGPDAPTAAVIPFLLCPVDTIDSNPLRSGKFYYGMTSYGGNGGLRSFDPEDATLDGIFHTTGPGSLPLPNQFPVAMADVTDGASQTLFFGERNHYDPNFETFAGRRWANSLQTVGMWSALGGRRRIADVTMSAAVPINYSQPFDLANYQQADPPIGNSRDFAYYENQRLCAWGSNHPDGANFALVDGSARFVRDAIGLEVLQALSTRNGRETIEEF